MTHLDLGDAHVQEYALRYLDENNVLVLVMAPTCRTLGPPSNVNYAINYDTWRAHYEEDLPHLTFCGHAACHQLAKHRHFLCEQPHPTWLWHVPPWPHIGQHPQVGVRIVHMCRLGLLGPNRLLVKKASEVIASAPELLTPFDNLK